MIRKQVMQMAESDPRFAQAVDMMEAQLARAPIVPEDLDEAIALLEFVLQNPDKYQEVRAAAVADGIIDEGMVPPEFDQVFIVSLLVALYGLQDRLVKQGYARGGLSVAARRLQTGGRGGDSELVHVNRREAEMLRRMGGQGTVNPNTGLREYKGFKQILGTVLPVALSVIAPGIGTAIGTALGASGIGASILGGAIIGGASSALTGGNIVKGTLMGGLGGGLGEAVGGLASDAFKLGLGDTTKAILGGTLVGGAAGALTGEGFGKGALQGAIGSGVGQLAGAAVGEGAGAIGQGIGTAGKVFGNALTAGYDPKTAAITGGLAGLAGGMNMAMKPSDAVVEAMPVSGGEAVPGQTLEPVSYGTPATGYDSSLGQIQTGGMLAEGSGEVAQPTTTVSDTTIPDATGDRIETGGTLSNVGPESVAPQAEPTLWQRITGQTGAQGSGGLTGTLGKLALGASALQSLTSAPPAVQQAASSLSPEQQEYFNRPNITWDWNKLQRDAAASNMSLSQYMANYWPQITSGVYNTGNQPVAMANGGVLSAVARFARGAGTGRSDEIDAKLSDGEFVMDAETVAMLGDGSSKAGAQKLEQMRRQIRSHKGKALAKGKFSPNAKSPLAYLKEVA